MSIVVPMYVITGTNMEIYMYSEYKFIQSQLSSP